MPFWKRFFSGRRSDYFDQAPIDTLVEQPRPSATRLGATPVITPWSTTRLITILQHFQSNPSGTSSDEARLARQCLSQFWLQTPIDQLQNLYQSPVGDCYRLLLSCGLSEQILLQEETVWRNFLSDRLSAHFNRPETCNILLGLMPYYPPGKMRVADPQQQIPNWLLHDYARLFEPELLARIWQPVGLLNPAGEKYGPAPGLGIRPPETKAPAQAPTTNPLPRLSIQRGAEALSIVQDPDFQRRMSGMINLFVIDPNDQQVIASLAELRRLLGQIWLDVQPSQMEALYSSPQFGRLYQELLASGFSRVLNNDEDRILRSQLATFVTDMSVPSAMNALMAVLPFYPPNKIAFGGGEQHLPEWLKRQMANIYGLQPESQPETIPTS